MKLEDLDFTIDVFVIANVGKLVRDGVSPSDFERAILTGEYDKACELAPPHIRNFSKEDLVFNMISMVGMLPKVFRETNEAIDQWCDWGGFSSAPSDIQMLFILEWDDKIFGAFQGLGKTFFND